MDRIRTAIIGCGGMGGGHAQRMKKMEEVEFVALCDLTEDIAGAAVRVRPYGRASLQT